MLAISPSLFGVDTPECSWSSGRWIPPFDLSEEWKKKSHGSISIPWSHSDMAKQCRNTRYFVEYVPYLSRRVFCPVLQEWWLKEKKKEHPPFRVAIIAFVSESSTRGSSTRYFNYYSIPTYRNFFQLSSINCTHQCRTISPASVEIPTVPESAYWHE